MLEVIIKAVFWLLTKISNIILYPLSALLSAIFPNSEQLLEAFKNFLNDNIFTNLLFVKQVAVNFGFPQIVLTFIVAYYTFLISAWAGGKIYLLAHRIYQNFKP